MKKSVVLLLILSGCASWHWEKYGATEGEYAFDETYCKQQVYSGTEGLVTNASVRRMQACMEGRGWRKVGNR